VNKTPARPRDDVLAYYYCVGRRSGTRCDPKINSVCGSVRRHRSARPNVWTRSRKVPAAAAAVARYHASFTRTRGRDGPGFSSAVQRFSIFLRVPTWLLQGERSATARLEFYRDNSVVVRSLHSHRRRLHDPATIL